MLTSRIAFVMLMLAGQAVSANILLLENFESFAGQGLEPGGGHGTLDSKLWAIAGLSMGDTRFGERLSSGDSARGRSPGRVRGGGLYAFEIAGGHALGWQSTGANLTPGSLFRRVLNETPVSWSNLWLNFNLWTFNDQPRSSSVNLRASTPGQPGIQLARFSTPLAAAAHPVWRRQAFSVSLGDALVPPGALMTFEWQLADAGGHGSRDELALDDLRLFRPTTAFQVDEGSTLLYSGFGLGLLLMRRYRAKTYRAKTLGARMNNR